MKLNRTGLFCPSVYTCLVKRWFDPGVLFLDFKQEKYAIQRFNNSFTSFPETTRFYSFQIFNLRNYPYRYNIKLMSHCILNQVQSKLLSSSITIIQIMVFNYIFGNDSLVIIMLQLYVALIQQSLIANHLLSDISIKVIDNYIIWEHFVCD